MRVALDLAQELALRGHRVHLFARAPPMGTAGFAPGVVFHRIDGSPDAAGHRLDTDWPAADLDALAERLTQLAIQAELDVLHFHYALPFAQVAAAVRERIGRGAPALVVTLHGTDVSVLGARPLTGRRLARWLSHADAITTVSHSHAALATRTLGLREPPQVIANFVVASRFGPRPVAAGARRPRLAHVSNFRTVKAPERIAEVFVRVRARLDAELWLVGDGERLPPLLAGVRAAGLGDDVRCFGLRRDVERILPHADVLLVTSRTESFCLAALEAAACGLATVAPRVGGVPEVVVDGTTGVLFEPGDVDGAARAIVALLGDPAALAHMRAAAARHAAAFASDRLVPRYEDLYRSLVAGRHLRRALTD